MGKTFVRWSLLSAGVLALGCATTAKQQGAKAAEAAPTAAAGAGQVVANPKEAFPVVIAKAAIQVDGDLSDWPAVPVGLLQKAGTKNAMKFRVFVDEANVYAAFEVTDPTPTVNKQDPGSNWDGDAVELFLGTHDESRVALKPGDVQVIVSYNPAKPLAWNYFSKQPMKDLAVAVKDAPGGYVVEARFSLAELGLAAPAPGAPVWLDVSLDDAKGGARVGQLVWHGTENDYQNPSLWKKTSFVSGP